MNLDIDRYDSPTGSMTASAQGAFVTYMDAVKMAQKIPANFTEHMLRHEAYGKRAEGVVALYRGQHAIPHHFSFYAFADVKDDDVGLTLHGFDHTGRAEFRTVYVPVRLFESKDESLVVAAARQYKSAELLRLEEERKIRQATKEASDRETLRRLMAEYPDEVKSPAKAPSSNLLVLNTVNYTVQVNLADLRGSFEHKTLGDGRGGSLLFEPLLGKLGTLVDADGTEVLPKEVALELRNNGFDVPSEFD